jgi:hypothetical protein
MPPEVHPDCQEFANDVTRYEAVVARLRDELQTLSGAAAWQKRAEFGRTSQLLKEAIERLNACNASHAAALQANLVVMDVNPTGTPEAQSRAAQLWQLSGATAFLEETPVQDALIAFTRDPPETFGINVTSTGVGDVSGPDFRGGPITKQSLDDANRRLEVVLGPEIRIDAAAISALLQTFPEWSQNVALGAIKVTITITTAKATLDANTVGGELSGLVTVIGFGGVTSRYAFAAGATMRVAPSMAPAVVDICDLVNVSDLLVAIPGLTGQLVDLVLPLVRPVLHEQLTLHIRSTLAREVERLVKNELALPDPLPSGIRVSIRRLAINASGITFQPTLGALGTTLSQLPPP